MAWDLRIAIFVGATLLLLYVSRASLRRPRSHGFFRFFAWEAILGLTLRECSALVPTLAVVEPDYLLASADGFD